MHNNITNKDLFFFIFKEIKPFYKTIGFMLLVALIWAISLSLKPYLLKIILNYLVESHADNIFLVLKVPIITYLLITFLHTSIVRFHNYFVDIKMIPYLRQNLIKKMVNTLLMQDYCYHQDNFSGSLANKVNDLANNVSDIIQVIIDRFFSHGLALVIAAYTLWQVNSEFGLGMIIWIIVATLSTALYSKKLVNRADKWSELGSLITGKIVDTLSNMLSVKLFTQENYEKLILNRTLQQTVKAEQKLGRLNLWLWFIYGYSFIILQGFNIYFLMKGRQQGLVSIGDFTLVLTLNISIGDLLWVMIKDFGQFSKYMGRATQALRTIASPVETQEKSNAKELVIKRGEIVFNNVWFHYKEAVPLFKNKSIIIKGGQKIGLVGYSGSGKTTFINLILRLFDTNLGRILIDQQDIKNVTLDSLRRSIALVPQNPLLFNRMILENIRYGRVEATDEEVIEAAKQSNAHEFITNLPQGYKTLVGEHGIKLSGGQRQQIAIARAFLKNAPILLLDESTSQLDSLTEKYLQDSLWKLMSGKTTIIIAHRLSTVLLMNRILVFNQGKIIQDNTHDELVAQEGLYKTLWNSQVDGFLPKK